MKICILLHSTSGNTKVVTDYAADFLVKAGHHCEVHDILESGDFVASLDEIDLLGVACPTMCFRPTWGIERAVARMPNVKGVRKPAFQLGTCAGEPGAHFALMAELLVHKGFQSIGAHWVIAPSNFPPHLAVMKPLASTAPIGTYLNKMSRPLRSFWGSFWPDSLVPDERDRRELEHYLEDVLFKAEHLELEMAPTPNELHKAYPTTNAVGRMFPREIIDLTLSLNIDPDRCTRCGTCAGVCPVEAITQPDEDEVPIIGRGCSACCACFNHCPESAFSMLGAKAGRGRYLGPPTPMKEVFRIQN